MTGSDITGADVGIEYSGFVAKGLGATGGGVTFVNASGTEFGCG
jgi:hypothetical protein